LIITSRTQGGKLHLVDIVGKIPLADITLLEDPNEEERTEDQGTLFDYLPTLYNVILRIARNLLETRENIKIESHPFYQIICD
jgi:hypothetical protein